MPPFPRSYPVRNNSSAGASVQLVDAIANSEGYTAYSLYDYETLCQIVCPVLVADYRQTYVQ